MFSNQEPPDLFQVKFLMRWVAVGWLLMEVMVKLIIIVIKVGARCQSWMEACPRGDPAVDWEACPAWESPPYGVWGDKPS